MHYPRRFFFLHHKWYIALFEIVSVIISIIALMIVLNPNEKNIYIAAVIPQNLDKEKTGKSIQDALAIYAERINKYGGINGQHLKIIFYDDQGDIETAKSIAKTIVKENKAIAVIGHFADNTTQAAGEIYHNASIPIISPISNIIPDQQWRFQLSPTQESYGIYMAHYIKSALKKNQISLIRADNSYDKQLIETLSYTFSNLGGEITTRFTISPHDSAADIMDIVEGLKYQIKNKSITKDHVLILSAPEAEIIPLIVALKQADIDLPMISSYGTLVNKFNHTKEESRYTGYYSNGIYTPAIILTDGINKPSLALVRKDYEIRHTHKINHIAMTASLATVFLINILERKEFNEMSDIAVARTRLKDLLQRFTWFDQHQIGKESVLHFGLYKKNTLITAPINPIIINNGDLSHMEEKEQYKKIININQSKLYMTNFVYTGVSMKKITHINLDELSYHLDFYLWFRYKKGVKHADDIEFINTKDPVKLYDLLKKTQHGKNSKNGTNVLSAKLVESQVLQGEVYRRYHIKAEFQTNKQKNYAVGQQNLYIRFRNNQSNTYQLRYLTDFGNSNKGVFYPESEKNNDSLIEQKDLKLNYNFEYISTSNKTTLGNPKDLSRSTRFSEFVAEYRVEYTLWSFRGLAAWVNKKISGREDQINTALMIILVFISFTIFNITRYIQRKNSLAGIPTYLWVLQLFTIFLILLFGEFVLSQAIFDLKYSDWGNQNRAEIKTLMLYTGYIIATLWWVIPAYYISSAIDQFLWKPIQSHTGTKIPAVLHLFIVILIYVLAILGIMAFVFDITVTGMAATSGVIALMFAIASKVDLSNIIAGLGISFSKTFNLGDWISINNTVEGKVIELSPRSTNILTADASIISIPNTIVANAIIKNYNRPTSNFRLVIEVETLSLYPVELVETILINALLMTENILTHPEPIVIFKGQGDNSNQSYEIIFYVDTYEKRHVIQQIAWRNIWNTLEQRKINLGSIPNGKIDHSQEISL